MNQGETTRLIFSREISNYRAMYALLHVFTTTLYPKSIFGVINNCFTTSKKVLKTDKRSSKLVGHHGICRAPYDGLS